MATKQIKVKKHPGPNITLVAKGPDPLERLAVAAEKLVTMLFTKDREALDREQKIRERALEIVQKTLEKQPGFDYSEMLHALVKEVSSGLSKVVDLKKLEVMTSKDSSRKDFSRKAAQAASHPA